MQPTPNRAGFDKTYDAIAAVNAALPPDVVRVWGDVAKQVLTPRRIDIQESLQRQPTTTTELARRLNRQTPAVSRDLRLLREYGVVHREEPRGEWRARPVIVLA